MGKFPRTKMAATPVHKLTDLGSSLEIEIQLPLVEKASSIDAYAENQVLEVDVPDQYSLKLPLTGYEIDEEELACKWSKKAHTLTITVPVLKREKVEKVKTPQSVVQEQESPAAPSLSYEPADEPVIAPEDIPELVQLEKQDIGEGFDKTSAPPTFSENGVSDFSIFKHDLGQQLDDIYKATRSSLPTIADSDSDSDSELEVVDVSAQLQALSQRTYENLRAVGLECPMTEDGLVDASKFEEHTSEMP